MYKLESNVHKSIETEMDDAGDVIDTLVGSFGDTSPIVVDAVSMYRDMITVENPTVVDYAVGSAFLRWVKRNPTTFGKPALRKCRCDAKFVLEIDSPPSYRPCETCLPDAYEKWAEGEGVNDEF